MNGIELLRQVRERWPRVYVIMITGFGTVEAAVEAMKLGAFDYVRKPFRSEAVQRIVTLIQDQAPPSSVPSGGEKDPVRLAEKWAKAGHGGLLLGATPRKALARVTTVDLPMTVSPPGSRTRSFGSSKRAPRPAMIIARGSSACSQRTGQRPRRGEIVQRRTAAARSASTRHSATRRSSRVRAAIFADRRAPSGRSRTRYGAHPATALEGPTSQVPAEVVERPGIDNSPEAVVPPGALQEEGLITHSSEASRLPRQPGKRLCGSFTR